MSKVKINFIADNNPLCSKKLENTEKLSEIRIKLKISDELVFQTNEGYDILKEDEEDYTIEDCLIEGNKIVLKKKEKENEKKEEEKKINTPVEKSEFIKEQNNLKIYLYPVDELTKEEEEKSIVLMVVGQTGSGKTTLLNAYINYLMGINYEDDFRYVMINEKFNKKQDESQTTEVTIYNIKTPDGTIIQIIDTPGFGDTGGIKKDIEITQKIRQTFIDKLTSITCVCFVAQSCNARLSANQKYIFNCILDLFGDDVKSNFICMLTFCDGTKPVILDSLQSDKFMFHEIIPFIESPWFYKINNSGIFEKDEENEFNLSFFNLGMKSFKEFTTRVKKLKKISLNKSKEVLEERQHLEKQVELLQLSLKEAIDKVNYIKGIIEMIKSVKGNLNGAKNFKKKIKTIRPKKIPIFDGRLITTCLTCCKTCHDKCFLQDEHKYNYAAMNRSDKNINIYERRCVVCKGKCLWSNHKNLPYIYKEEVVEEIVTLEELKKLFFVLFKRAFLIIVKKINKK